MPKKHQKINKAGYYIRHWFDDVYLVSDMVKGIDYVTAQPEIFYNRPKQITIKPVLRKEPDLNALVVAIMHILDEEER